MVETQLEPSTVNVRIKISALWTSMLFVFAYVDLFSLYRPDVRADLEAGEIGGFTVDRALLFGTTVYVVIPSLMVFCALVLRPQVDRIANIAEHHLRAHDRRGRHRRVELLRPRERHRGCLARGRRLLRLDLAEGTCRQVVEVNPVDGPDRAGVAVRCGRGRREVVGPGLLVTTISTASGAQAVAHLVLATTR
jgi:hypothetical protein